MIFSLEKKKKDVGECRHAEIYLSKQYRENAQGDPSNDSASPDYFYMGIHAFEDLEEIINIVEVDGSEYFRLAVTDQAHYPKLIYDFSLGYLQLNPDQYISLYGDNLISFDDMKAREAEGGYYEDWCY